MSKKSAGKKSSKRPAPKRTPSRKSAKKKTIPKKTVARRKAPAQKTGTLKPVTKRVASTGSKPSSPVKTKSRVDRQRPRSSPLSPPLSGLQSGDLQGLSNVESADSESVDELLEEGNAFEAGIVSGVEESRNREGQEVRTRELPEDDVPEEYLDEQ